MRGEERVFVEECKVVMGRLWCLCVFEWVCIVDSKTRRVMRRLRAMLYFPTKLMIDQRGVCLVPLLCNSVCDWSWFLSGISKTFIHHSDLSWSHSLWQWPDSWADPSFCHSQLSLSLLELIPVQWLELISISDTDLSWSLFFSNNDLSKFSFCGSDVSCEFIPFSVTVIWADISPWANPHPCADPDFQYSDLIQSFYQWQWPLFLADHSCSFGPFLSELIPLSLSWSSFQWSDFSWSLPELFYDSDLSWSPF